MRSSVKMNCPSCKHSILQPFVEPCCKCNDGSEFKPKTNADRIRSMPDEELAEMLNHAQGDGYLVGIGQRKMSAYGNWLEWLKQECET